jgi:sulfatase modifying factor 1
MARVPGGRYGVGRKEANPHPVHGLPWHEVEIPSFELDVTEVTVADYAACVDAGGCVDAGLSGEECNWGKPTLREHPLNCVAFKQAAAYCAWAEKRLPTDDEWEIAINEDLLRETKLSGFAMERGCVTAESTSGCRPIGRSPFIEPSPPPRPRGTCVPGTNKLRESRLGIHDLIGNVSEWTTGRFCLWKKGWCEENVVRGMGWCESWYDDLTLRRLGEETDSPAITAPTWLVGFRCAR